MASIRTVLVLAASLGLSACSGDSATATSPSATAAAPTTMTFASHLAPGGSTSRAFTTSAAGTISVTLTSFGTTSESVGIGVGVPLGASPCSLARSLTVRAASTPQIVEVADAGSYCVQLFDTGDLRGETPFSVTIVYP